MRRAWAEIEKAELILFVVDATESDDPDFMATSPEYFTRFPDARQPVPLVTHTIVR